MKQLLRPVTFVLALCLCCRAATSATVHFTFTGIGINGSMASGAFAIDDAALEPAYYGQISQYAPIFNFSLTISNIPGESAASLSFDPQGYAVLFGLDNAGVPRIIPGASFTFPSGNWYRLDANTDFYAPPFTPDYHSRLSFASVSTVQRDDITWAPAILVVPELDGDYNFDSFVDAADYAIWRKTDGTQARYNLWRSHFGGPPGSGAGASVNVSVPEPATLVLLLFAVADWCLRRGRAA